MYQKFHESQMYQNFLMNHYFRSILNFHLNLTNQNYLKNH
jgi:hypothetical protein